MLAALLLSQLLAPRAHAALVRGGDATPSVHVLEDAGLLTSRLDPHSGERRPHPPAWLSPLTTSFHPYAEPREDVQTPAVAYPREWAPLSRSSSTSSTAAAASRAASAARGGGVDTCEGDALLRWNGMWERWQDCESRRRRSRLPPAPAAGTAGCGCEWSAIAAAVAAASSSSSSSSSSLPPSSATAEGDAAASGPLQQQLRWAWWGSADPPADGRRVGGRGASSAPIPPPFVVLRRVTTLAEDAESCPFATASRRDEATLSQAAAAALLRSRVKAGEAAGTDGKAEAEGDDDEPEEEGSGTDGVPRGGPPPAGRGAPYPWSFESRRAERVRRMRLIPAARRPLHVLSRLLRLDPLTADAAVVHMSALTDEEDVRTTASVLARNADVLRRVILVVSAGVGAGGGGNSSSAASGSSAAAAAAAAVVGRLSFLLRRHLPTSLSSALDFAPAPLPPDVPSASSACADGPSTVFTTLLSEADLRRHADACAGAAGAAGAAGGGFIRHGVCPPAPRRLYAGPSALPSLKTYAKLAWEHDGGEAEHLSYVTHALAVQLLLRMPLLPPIAVEVLDGARAAEGPQHSHIIHLSIAQGWRGVILSTAAASATTPALAYMAQVLPHSLAPRNVPDALAEQRVPPVFGFLRLDASASDPAVAEAVFSRGFRPAVLSFGFSRAFGGGDVCVMRGGGPRGGAPRQQLTSRSARSAGAGHSLGWWRALLLRHGYTIVSTLLDSGYAVPLERLPFIESVLDPALAYTMAGRTEDDAARCVVDTTGASLWDNGGSDGAAAVSASAAEAGEWKDGAEEDAGVASGSGSSQPPTDDDGDGGPPHVIFTSTSSSPSPVLPPIFIISLPHREDRRSAAVAELVEGAGYPAHLVHHVPGVRVPESGPLGCTLAHVRALKRAAMDDGASHEHFIVLEDDAGLVFPFNFTATVAHIVETLTGTAASTTAPLAHPPPRVPYDVVLLSTRCGYRSGAGLPPPLVRVRGSVSSGGYLVRAGYVPTFVALLLRSAAVLVADPPGSLRGSLDQMFKDLQMSDTWLSVRPSPIKQRASDSDVTGKKDAAYTFKDLDELDLRGFEACPG